MKNLANEEKIILTASELNAYLKGKFENDAFLSSVNIRAEISNFTNHKSGHLYFTLKDETGLVKCVMFRSAASKLLFEPENGIKVICHGRVSVFVRDGQYIYYVDRMEPDGIGALYLAYEQLKRKLDALGLFDPNLKKKLPKIPMRVGIITSPTGAAVRDIFNVLKRRFPFADAVLFPAQVQGASAEPELIKGIRTFNELNNVNVIIIGRGGGSIEDLWAFNSEALAVEIRKSKIPVISAVGHETDFTICDFAADLRAPTPSAAAELAVPETSELKHKFENIVARMKVLLDSNIKMKRERVLQLSDRRALKSPGYIVDDKRLSLENVSSKLDYSLNLALNARSQRFARVTAKLEALNPMSVISRGYSAVFTDKGKLVKSVDEINVGDSFTFRTLDGTVDGRVTDKRKGKI